MKNGWRERKEKPNDRKRKHNKAFGKQPVNWGEKRDKKRLKAQELEQGINEPYEISKYTIGSDKFNEYYKVSFGSQSLKVAIFLTAFLFDFLKRVFAEVIPTEKEFQKFVKTLYDKLPVTFRINSGEAGFQRVSQLLKNPEFIK